MNSENEIINWSFHLTKVKCSLLVENQHIDALLTRKSNARITSRILKPIKDYIEDLDKIIEISNEFRKKQLLDGKIELPKSNNNIYRKTQKRGSFGSSRRINVFSTISTSPRSTIQSRVVIICTLCTQRWLTQKVKL